MSEINSLDSAVYGGGGNYGQKPSFGHQTSGYSSDYNYSNPSNYQYTPYSAYEQQTRQYDSPQYGKTNQSYDGRQFESPQYGKTNQSYETKQFDSSQYGKTSQSFEPKQFDSPQYGKTNQTYSQTNTNTTPKPFTSDTSYEKSYDYSSRYDNVPSSGSYTKFDTSTHAFEPPKYDFKTTGDGYTTKEYTTSTYKIPGGTQTDTYKYETYQSASDPVYSSSSEKYYTSTPNSKFTPIKNGSAFSSNVEYIKETPVLKDSDSLEQKMLKKSVTQQVIEKRTVQTTRSTKQESSTKNFRFD